MPSAPEPRLQSESALLKARGWKNWNHFMQDFDLKIWDADDINKAKAIIESLRDEAQADWEEKREAEKKLKKDDSAKSSKSTN